MSTYGKTIYNPHEESSQWIEQIKVSVRDSVTVTTFVVFTVSVRDSVTVTTFVVFTVNV